MVYALAAGMTPILGVQYVVPAKGIDAKGNPEAMVATKNPVSDENEQPPQPPPQDKVNPKGPANNTRLILDFSKT